MTDAIAAETGFSLQAEDGSFIYADALAAPTGDKDDFARRLAAVLPRRWFADDAPIIAALLQGVGSAFADVWTLLAFTRAQTRLATATGAFLDLASTDFLTNFLRRANEPDAAFSLRLRREIVRPRNTRVAIVQVLDDLTGNTPTVIRPSNPVDCGGWDTGYLGWDTAGAWGDLNMPFQAFVTIQRGTAPGAGVTATLNYPAGGWDTLGGWDTGSSAWTDIQEAQGGVTDDDIYRAVASVTPEGHIFWTQITGTPPLPQAGFIPNQTRFPFFFAF